MRHSTMHKKMDGAGKTMNPLVGGMIGAVAGAALGSATAFALGDEKTKKRVSKQIEDIKNTANKTFKDIKGGELGRTVSRYVSEGRKAMKRSMK